MADSLPMMSCGCVANSKDGDGNYACVIHWSLRGEPQPTVVETPDLTGRQARCTYDSGHGCKGNSRYFEHGKDSTVPSDTQKLAFFKHTPTLTYDSYYNGCWGWD